jgi:TPP-dependent pyruvate/acetoin dehydrogenase alpha subunit
MRSKIATGDFHSTASIDQIMSSPVITVVENVFGRSPIVDVKSTMSLIYVSHRTVLINRI